MRGTVLRTAMQKYGRTRQQKLLFPLLVPFIILSMVGGSRTTAASALSIQPNARFGITAPLNPAGYDLAALHIGAYLDWSASGSPALPSGVEYIRVLRVGDAAYSSVLQDLPNLVANHPGSVWLIGNEPDRADVQDDLTPETYADRYYALAGQIRGIDPTAKLGFGSIVQPTPIRLRYLERAYQQIIRHTGSRSAASALIDIWSIHAFILNEQTIGWGAGIPPGFENDRADAVVIRNFADTYSLSILIQRVNAFRKWMSNHGERSKPLWITEYGSLFPPLDPPGGPDYVNVSDRDTASFMVGSFNFFLRARDSSIGYPADENRLVQRWFWYSLNEHRYTFGGSLYDPDDQKKVTPVGKAFQAYLAHPPSFFYYLSTIRR